MDENAYALDLLLCQGDNEDLSSLRKLRGLYDLRLDYREALIGSPHESEPIEPDRDQIGDRVRYGSLLITSPRACLVQMHRLTTELLGEPFKPNFGGLYCSKTSRDKGIPAGASVGTA